MAADVQVLELGEHLSRDVGESLRRLSGCGSCAVFRAELVPINALEGCKTVIPLQLNDEIIERGLAAAPP